MSNKKPVEKFSAMKDALTLALKKHNETHGYKMLNKKDSKDNKEVVND